MTDAPAAPRLPAETVVGQFKVLRLLGRGGMGEVYLARDTTLGRRVALKLVRPEAMGSREAVERFLFEARTTARFSHPHIVTVYAAGEHEGAPWVALEYLEGQTLEERLREGRPSLPEALRTGEAIAQALAEAHRHEVVHRDLKPANVLFGRDGRLRVVDFGLARQVGADAALARTAPPGTEETGRDVFRSLGVGLRGTPMYMAPEQWDERPATPACDVWALGLILHELLAGAHPFAGAGLARLCRLATAPEAVPPIGAAGLPPEVARVVDACLARGAEARPSATEVARALGAGLAGRAPRIGEEESPFRGLLPFDERHATLFFGRGDEVAALVERLRREPVQVVVGPSGAGKSSFVRAGVLPRLRDQGGWTVVALRPGARPLRALALATLRAEASGSTGARSSPPPAAPAEEASEQVDRLAAELAATPARLALRLAQLAAHDGGRALLLVDQAEELFTLCDDPAARRAFLEAAAAAADDPDGPVRCVLTLRDAFLGRLTEAPAARDALGHVTLLGPPGATALEEVLARSAAAAGYGFEDEDLAREMVRELGGEPAALPLLQFAGEALWRQRDAGRRLLTRAAYRAIGGAAGALARHADEALEGLPPEDVVTARSLLLRLVTPEGTRRTVARTALLEGLGPGGATVLERLAGTRLLTVRRSRGADADAPEVELAHESLVVAWGRLARWLEESREERSALAGLEEAATHWERRGEREEALLLGDSLVEARRALARAVGDVPDRVRRFVQASASLAAAGARRRRRRLAAVVASLTLLAAAASLAALAFARQGQAERRHRAAAEAARAREETARAGTLQEAAASALARAAPLEARALVRESLTLRDSLSARALWERLRREPLRWEGRFQSPNTDWTPGGRLGYLAPGGALHLLDPSSTRAEAPWPAQLSGNGAPAFSADGRLVALRSDDRVEVRRLGDGELVAGFGASGLGWGPLLFSLDGRRLLVPGAPGPSLWDATTGARLATLPPSTALGGAAGLAVLGDDGGWVTAHDLATGGERWRRRAHAGRVGAVAVRADGERVATLGPGGDVTVSDGRTGAELARLALPDSSAVLAFAGERLAAGGRDGSLRVWRLPATATGAATLLLDVQATGSNVRVVTASPDGRWIATSGADAIRVWDAHAAPPEPPRGHPGVVGSVAATDRLAVTCDLEEPRIRLWDLEARRPAGALAVRHGLAMDLDVSPDGRRLAVALTDGEVDVLSMPEGRLLRVLPDARVATVRFGRDGRSLVTGSFEGTLRVWDLQGDLPPVVLAGDPRMVLFAALDPAGRRLLSSTVAKVQAWDLDRRRLLWEMATSGPASAAIAPDGQAVIASSEAGHVLVERRDLTAGARVELARLPAPTGALGGIDVDPRGRWLAVGIGRSVQVLEWPSGSPRARLAAWAAGALLRFSTDGAWLVTPGWAGTSAWRTSDWRLAGAVALLPAPPRLVSERGLELLEPAAAVGEAPASAWLAALRASRPVLTHPRADVICVVPPHDELQLWDPASDRMLVARPVAGIVTAAAQPGGCLVSAPSGSRLIRRDGREVAIPGDVILGVDPDGFAGATLTELSFYDASGVRTETRPLPRPLVAVARTERGALALFHADGTAEIAGAAGTVRLRGVPGVSPVLATAGPGDTIVATFWNGEVGVWDAATGARLELRKLQGIASFLLREGDVVHAATMMGDRTRIDLGYVGRSWCDVLREVWAAAPSQWRGGGLVPAEVAAGHACGR